MALYSSGRSFRHGCNNQEVEVSIFLENSFPDTREFINKCDICQRHKYDASAYLGLLQPLPIPKGVWTDICLDFIEGLPKSNGKEVILVVVDRLSKYGHFMSLQYPYTA